MVLHQYAMDQKIQEMKFSAILHGADPKELEDKQITDVKRKDNLLFGDPKDYDKMDEKSKKELSDKMKAKFMKWAQVK
jgi:hypothetical protein